MNNPLQVLQHPLSDHAVHVDFIRLRCGSEARFARGIAAVLERSDDPIHTFIAFSEWDAVIVVPCSELYPRTLTAIYANANVAASVSGTSGYFAYLWEHPVNHLWREQLTHAARSGPSVLMSLRFADWFRRDLGLGTEILFCNYLQKLAEESGVNVVVAHSLGWNDVVLLIHTDRAEENLTKVLAKVRLTTLRDCVGYDAARTLGFSESPEAQIFAASYSHLLGGFGRYRLNRLSLGNLTSQIESARILIRVAPPHERGVRTFMAGRSKKIGVKIVPSEMGHYSLSIDISAITAKATDGGRKAIAFIAETRRVIGRLSRSTPDSYAETTTILRFEEPRGAQPSVPAPRMPKELRTEIQAVEDVMRDLPHRLRQRGISSMTSHRFVSVLTTLLDHLSDPVRNSVVRHLSRFAQAIPALVAELDADGIEDLCHVLEYAVGQAIDGIAQFQHDANALGLSGRGGYSRMIVAVEWYIRATFARLGIEARLPLITFGLRSGNAGSTGRYQIDIPFNVLFVPSRWHILLHEIGHMAWIEMFGWMMDSLAIYRAMEKEVRVDVARYLRNKHPKMSRAKAREIAKEQFHVEFLRTREIVRELFPSYLIFALPCNGDIEQFDALAFRRMLSLGHPSSLTRELLLRVVMHCLLVIMRDEMKPGGAADPKKSRTAARLARRWWAIWDRLKKQNHGKAVREAIESIGETMTRVSAEASGRQAKLGQKMQILNSPLFKASAIEAVDSVIQLLALRARHFEQIDREHISPELFGKLLQRISDAHEQQSHPAYEAWIGAAFAEWLHEGEVLTRHRDSFIWSRLLLGSRDDLLKGSRSEFMRSQLSVLLSIWHDAATELYESREKIDHILKTLQVVRTKENVVERPAKPSAAINPRSTLAE
jgi:hypothetical protein